MAQAFSNNAIWHNMKNSIKEEYVPMSVMFNGVWPSAIEPQLELKVEFLFVMSCGITPNNNGINDN